MPTVPLRWRDYARSVLRDDLLAAVVISVLLIPQSLAYALLAGLPPQVGLYASLLPLVAYAAFGSSPVLSVGPAAVLALMISQALAQVPADVGAVPAALVLAAEVGLLLALAAWWRLDALAALLSVPVLHGFETGATFSIALSQMPVLLGASAHGSNLPEVVSSWWRADTAWVPLTAAFGAVAMLLLWLVRRYAAAWLARHVGAGMARQAVRFMPLVVLLLAIVVAAGVDAQGHGVTLIGALPPMTPRLTLPPVDAALWWRLLPSALPIALVAFVSSLVVAESFGRRLGHLIDPRRELAGLAAANLAAAFSAGMPVAASFSRSAVSVDAGSRTRMAGVFTAALMGAAMLLLARPLAALPTTVLAATIVVAVLSGLAFGPFREAWRYSRAEAVLMVVVALLTLTAGVGWALGIGVAASIGLLLQRTARPHVALIGRVPGTEHYRNVGRFETELTAGVTALRIDESLLFTNARQLGDVVQQHLARHPDTRRVVLLMSPVNRIDFSGLEALKALHEALAARGIRLDLSEVKGPVLDALRAGGWSGWFRGRLFLSQHHAMRDDQDSGVCWVH
ncbi:MAG TPA: SulP family inorganic anion transporter [Albitalea sp.]|nr:SulP family inorganic anion transporter [Albitalea sp.]